MSSILGRAPELEVLSAALAADGTRVVVLTGVAGSGKTRLLAEVAGLAADKQVVHMRGFQPEMAAPLVAAGPLLSVLASVDSRLNDVLRQDAPGAMVHLFELTHRALKKVGGDVVLVVDDEQWLDATTRALLHYLVRSSATELGDLCLVSASRPSRVSTEMHESFRTVLGDPNLTVVPVPPLDRDSGIALARRVDPGIPASMAVEHWERAKGSPFWLTLLASGERGSTDGLIQARLAGCGPPSRALLEVLAVAARPVEVATLADLLGIAPDLAGAALAELEDRGLVLVRAGSVTVVHDLVRETVVAEIDAERARRRHREVAGWLARSEEPAVVLAALQHRARAGDPVDDLAAQILASPRRAWLGVDGAAELVRLVLGRVSDPQPDLLVELATLADEVGEAGLALEVWSRVALGRGPEALRHRACIGAGRAAYESTDLEAAHTWLRRARSFDSDDVGLSVAVEVLESDVLRWLESRFEEADARSRAAMRLVEAASSTGQDVRRAAVEALGSLGDAAMVRGDVVAMDDYADRLEEHSGGDPELAYAAMLYRVTSLNLQGELRRALDLVAPHWEAALESGSPAKQVSLGGYVVSFLTETARLVEAQEVAAGLHRLVERMTDPHRRLAMGISVWFAEAAVLELDLLTGDWRRALERVCVALDNMLPHNAITRAAATAEQWSRLGAPTDPMVETLAARSFALAEEVGCPRCGEEARLVVARCRARAGDLEGARTILDAWDRPSAPRDVHRRVSWTRALLLAGAERYDAAAGLFDGVEAELRGSGAELERMWLLLDRARALKEADVAGSVAACEQLATRAHEVGAPNLVAIAQRELRSLGARPWRRGTTAGEGLSDRESQVTALVAEGLTNPEIAARLFLSRKTVERHVSNALGKLGARNRTELAAAWRASARSSEGVPR